MRKEVTLTVWIVLLLLPAKMTFSAWSTYPTVNTPVCTATDGQYSPDIVSDGSGGAIITWFDHRSGGTDAIYAQRLDSSGNALWTADGVAVSTNVSGSVGPQLISDGSGGAIITWQDRRSTAIDPYDIYAQRLDSAGNALWTANGVAVCTANDDQSYPQLISDGSGGAIITWEDQRSGEYDIYAQRLDSAGNALWTTDGVDVSTVAIYTQWRPQLISDGSGGAIITWQDSRSGSYDIYAQRVDSNGSSLWTTDGMPVCSATNYQEKPQITSDGSGGAIITWEDWRGGVAPDIYAQRMDSSGNPLWIANGVPVCTVTNYQTKPQITSDGSGGTIITWEDFRSGTTYDIYAQRMDFNGNALWTADGVPVCTASIYDQIEPQLISDGSSGAIITWEDYRSGITNGDIYAQRMDSNGNAHWTADGEAVCTASGSNQYGPQLISDSSGRAIITWYDYRGYPNPDIYAQHINPDGSLGAPLEQATLIVPWYNDAEGSNLLASFITVFNSSSQAITVTVTYTGPGSVDATPSANTFTIGAQSSKSGRPFQVSGLGEGQEQGPPTSMPNATTSAPFGSATFTAQVPVGFKIYGDTLRIGTMDFFPEPFSGIAPAVSQ